MTCHEVAGDILNWTKVTRGAELETKNLEEEDIARIAKKTIISEVARKTSELMSFTECEIVNQSEVTTITEAGPKSSEATISHGENQTEMTSIFGEEMSGKTTTYERGIGSLTKTTSDPDEETSGMTNISEAAFVKSTRMICRGPAADVIFPDVRLREEMKDIGKDAEREMPEKYSLATGTGGGLIFPDRTWQTSKFFD